MPVTARGCDYAFSHPTIDSMKAAGLTFACRYLYPFSQVPGTKNLTLPEATALNAALEHGVVSNFESWASRALDGHDAGVDDARAAQAQHTACGGRMDRPIYFSVDFDAQPAQYPAIRAYMLGVASVIGANRTGVYGSYSMVKWLLDNQLVTWAWQTYAWSGGRFDERSQLAQDKNGVPLGGGEVDLDTAHAADFGQWNWTGDDSMSADDVAALTKYLNSKFAAVDVDLERIKEGIGGAKDFPGLIVNGDPTHTHNLTVIDKKLDAIGKAVTAATEIVLTPEQVAAIAAIVAESATPNYGGHVILEPIAPNPAP